MEKNFLQRLQRVKLSDLIHIFLFVMAIIPAMIYKKQHKHLWLISECKDEARDNGYWLYKYIREHDKEQEIVYAIKHNSYDYKKVASIGKTVSFGSLMHWIMYLACEVRISSQKAGTPNSAVCYVLEHLGIVKKKMVFLQHGIIKDDLPYVYSNNAKISLFSTTTQKEFNYVVDKFGYENNVVKKLGLCRYDDLQNEKDKDNDIILIMPTWRQWIVNRDFKSKHVENFKKFTDTEFFNMWNSFIQSESFFNFLKKNNKKVIFYLHRNMQRYNKYFKSNEYVTVVSFPEYDAHELLKQASILITDYSSVAMDFAYIGKRVLYYQFDYTKFRTHHLQPGYFNYEADGFGGVAYNQPSLIEWLQYYTETGYTNDFFKKRIHNFFDRKDGKNCERTYLEIKRLLEND